MEERKIKRGDIYHADLNPVICIERNPKTPNSFRVLRVPEVIVSELEKRKYLIDMYKEKCRMILLTMAISVVRQMERYIACLP